MAIKTGVRVTSDGQNWTEFSGDGVLNSIQTTGLTADTLYTAIAFLDDDGTEITSNGAKFTTAPPPYVTLKNEYGGENTITITKRGSTWQTRNVEYSTDGGNTWTDIHNGGSVTLAEGGEMKLRSSNGFSYKTRSYYSIDAENVYSASGNLATLVDYTNYSSLTTIPESNFCNMFSNSTNLVDVDDLTFGGMNLFEIGSCYYMFASTSITTPPKFQTQNAWRDEACTGMFSRCELLEKVPSVTVTYCGVRACYYMFQNCTALTTAENMSVRSAGVESGLSYMFTNCTSLVTGANLRSITSVGNSALNYTYYNCSSLENVYAPSVSSWNDEKSKSWLYGVAASGRVYKPAALEITADSDSGVPVGWETEDYV